MIPFKLILLECWLCSSQHNFPQSNESSNGQQMKWSGLTCLTESRTRPAVEGRSCRLFWSPSGTSKPRRRALHRKPHRERLRCRLDTPGRRPRRGCCLRQSSHMPMATARTWAPLRMMNVRYRRINWKSWNACGWRPRRNQCSCKLKLEKIQCFGLTLTGGKT